MPKLVKYACGCIGFSPDPNDPKQEKVWLVDCCDRNSDDYQYGFGTRNMTGKTFKPLENYETEDILNTLSNLIMDGYKLRNLKLILK